MEREKSNYSKHSCSRFFASPTKIEKVLSTLLFIIIIFLIDSMRNFVYYTSFWP